MRRHSFFRRTNQMNYEKPLIERDARTFKNRSDRNRKLFFTVFALPQTFSRLSPFGGLGFDLIRADIFTMRTNHTIFPSQFFQQFI